jgi:hypothetical protein
VMLKAYWAKSIGQSVSRKPTYFHSIKAMDLGLCF